MSRGNPTDVLLPTHPPEDPQVKPPHDSDTETMLAFQAGDEMAFRQLFQKYTQPIVHYCHRYVYSTAVAEELAQDVFLRVYDARARYQPTAKFRTWLYRIATNVALNEVRRSKNRGTVVVVEEERLAAPDALNGETLARRREIVTAVQSALATLKPPERSAYILLKFQGCSITEIAEVLEMKANTVKSHIHRANQKMIRLLKGLKPEGAL